MKKGYEKFKNVLKTENFKMKENEKINYFEEDSWFLSNQCLTVTTTLKPKEGISSLHFQDNKDNDKFKELSINFSSVQFKEELKS